MQQANLGTTVVVLRDVRGLNQQPITQISVSSCVRRIVNTTTGEVVDVGTPLSIPDVVFNTARADNGWKFVGGYNFKDQFVAASVGYWEIIYTFVDSNSNPIVDTGQIQVIAVP